MQSINILKKIVSICSLYIILISAANAEICGRVLDQVYNQTYQQFTNFSKYALYKDILDTSETDARSKWGVKGVIPIKGLPPIEIGADMSKYNNFRQKIHQVINELNINYTNDYLSKLTVSKDVLDSWVDCLKITNGGLRVAFAPSGGIEINWIPPLHGTNQKNSIDIFDITVQSTLKPVNSYKGVLVANNPRIIHVERIGNEGGWVHFKTSVGDIEVEILPILPDICEISPELCWEGKGPDTHHVKGQQLWVGKVGSLDEAFIKARKYGGDSFMYGDNATQLKDVEIYKGTIQPGCNGCQSKLTYAYEKKY